MKVSTEIDNHFGYEKITQLVDNIPLKEKKLEPHWVFQQFFLFILGEGSIITPTGKVDHFARLI
jgi:hypothetical protein